MHIKIILYSLLFSSVLGCSSLYKNTQTPDDVYYSPTTPINGEKQKREELVDQPYRNAEERELVMSCHDSRWRYFDDDYNYRYDPYHYGYTYGYYFNPFYHPVPIYYLSNSFVNPKNSTPRMTNLASYQNTIAVSPKYKASSKSSFNRRNYYNNYESSKMGRIFSSSESGSSGETGTRSYTPSSQSNSSSSGSSISRPGRN